MNKTEFILNDDGKIIRRDVTEQLVNVDTAVIEAFTRDAFVKQKYLFQVKTPYGVDLNVNASLNSREAYFTLHLPCLPLRAPFAVNEGVLTPSFSGGSVTMPMMWMLPTQMRLVLLVRCTPMQFANAWLFAMDPNAAAYRLPASNIYGDCRLCLGDFLHTSKSTAAALESTVHQFYNSNWNADLWNDNPNTAKLFRFKPLASDKFETLPPLAAWPTLCDKVGNAVLERLVL